MRQVKDQMTIEYYPDKLTLEEFCEEIQDSICDFACNMKDLKVESKYAEEWMKMFVAWMEMQ